MISAIELEPAENEEENNPTTPTQASISQVQINPMNPGEVAQNPTFTQAVPLNQQPKIVRGKTRGETVSLRLEMAAYFRRPIVQPTQISTQQ